MTEGGTQESRRGPGRTWSLWFPGWQCTGYSDSPRRRSPDPPKPRSHHFRLPQQLRPRSSNPTTVPSPQPIVSPASALANSHAKSRPALPRSRRPHSPRCSLAQWADALSACNLSGTQRPDGTWREEAWRQRADATNRKSQRVPLATNRRGVRGVADYGSGGRKYGGLSPTGSAIGGRDIAGEC